MQLSEKEGRILSYIEHDFRQPLSDVANSLGYREHVVRHVVQKHKRSGLLRERVFMNPYRLGYTTYSILLSCENLTSQISRRFVALLDDQPHVTTIIELGGMYDFQIELLTLHPRELASFMTWLSSEFGEVLKRKQVSMQIHQSIFGFKFFNQNNRPIQEVSYSLSDSTCAIDPLDKQILVALAETGSPSGLHKVLGIPASTLEYRLKRLEEKKVIVGYIYEMTGPSLGLNSFLVNIYTKQISDKVSKKFHDFGLSHPYITFFNHDIGCWDYKFGISVPAQRDAKLVEEEIHGKFGNWISAIDLVPRFKTYKAKSFPSEASSESFKKAAN